MSAYSNFVLTDQGLNLLNDLIKGDGELEFRHMSIGSGSYMDDEKDLKMIRRMTSLREERQRIGFSSVHKHDKSVELKAHITNQGVAEEYPMTELGIHASMKNSENEVLYCVSLREGSPDVMPDFSSGRIQDIIFKVQVSIGDVPNVSIVYKSDIYALAEDFDSHVKDAVKHVTVAERTKWDGKMETMGDSKDNTVAFSSGDDARPSGWADIEVMTSGEKHSSLFRKMSLAVKNLRYLWRLLGTTSLAGIGDGTVTGAISSLNTGLTELLIPNIAINNEDELMAYLDNITDTDETWYRRTFGLNIAVSIWPVGGGGVYYVEGYRTSEKYEWQKAMSYGDPIRCFMRSKRNGVWSGWTDTGFYYAEFTNRFEASPNIVISKAYIRNRMVFIMGYLAPSPAGAYRLLIPSVYRPLYNAVAPHHVSNSVDVECVSAIYIESASTIAIWTNRANVANITFSFLYPI